MTTANRPLSITTEAIIAGLDAIAHGQQAAKRTLNMVKRLGGRGGLIVIDRSGTVAMPFVTEGMYRGIRRSNTSVRTGIHRDDRQRRLTPLTPSNRIP